MLTGRESLGAALAAVAHRRRAATALCRAGHDVTWGELGSDVRRVALGLVEGGLRPGERREVAGADPAGRLVLTLSLLSVGGVVAHHDASATPIETGGLDELRRVGGRADENGPSAFEDLWQAVGPDDPAAEGCRGPLSHDALLAAGRSLAQAMEVNAADRILCTVDGLGGLAASVIVPVLTGAATLLDAAEGGPFTSALPSVAVVDAETERGSSVLGACRVVLVVDSGTGTARRLSSLGVRAHAALAVPGVAGLVTGLDGASSMGRPLPGVVVAIDDDGEVLVRAPGAPALDGSAGWVRTGLKGSLDRSRLSLGDSGQASG